MQSIEFRHLNHFIQLTQTLHFGRASELCHTSASALSRQLQQLETTLGVRLLERDNRHVELTPAGQRFLTYARETLDQWETLQADLLAEHQSLKGQLSVYCSVTASYSFLYDQLKAFRQRHPGVEITLHTGDPDVAISRVQQGEEDLAIAARPDQLPQGIAFQSMGLSPLVFIAPLAGETDFNLTTPPDWSQIPMIVSEQGVARERLDNWFRQQKIRPHIYAQVSGNEAIVSMVSLGLGLGVVPQIVLDNSPLQQKVRILTVSPGLAAYDVGVVALQRKLRHPLVQAFWDQLSQP